MKLRTCVSPSGFFKYGIHKPRFTVDNLRETDHIMTLGRCTDDTPCKNQENFPHDSIEENEADWIYEIPNAFPFRGTTYIARRWAEAKAENTDAIRLPSPSPVSLSETVKKWFDEKAEGIQHLEKVLHTMPEPLLLALATTSTDSNDLVSLAELSCEFIYSSDHTPIGLRYEKDTVGIPKPGVKNWALFEAVANNIHLPNVYKEVMVLRPGVQGDSEIVGEWKDNQHQSHIFEYLRRNSYIPWGHYAANMAHDAVRYRIEDLTSMDMSGLRHLYYQRTYVRLAKQLGVGNIPHGKTLSSQDLEALRLQIVDQLNLDKETKKTLFDCTLWGWNFGFDFAPSHYRLHASHQQIHQQFALVPESIPAWNDDDKDSSLVNEIPAYACGDLIENFVREYKRLYSKNFFDNYIKAVRSNKRMDGRKNRPDGLIVYEDKNVMLFVPKAQTSQWELQLMALKPVGNIIEADLEMRKSLNTGMYVAVTSLAAMGAQMITSIEFSKRFLLKDIDQRLMYSFLPKLPESPGAFSEAQLRWINGHYPEDFADVCRKNSQKILEKSDG